MKEFFLGIFTGLVANFIYDAIKNKSFSIREYLEDFSWIIFICSIPLSFGYFGLIIYFLIKIDLVQPETHILESVFSYPIYGICLALTYKFLIGNNF